MARLAPTLVLVLIAIVGVAVRLFPLLTPNTSVGSIEYDAGVYYGAAALAVDGLAPYRDFVLLHPPGIVLLLGPFAAIGSVTDDRLGFMLARLLVVAVALVDLLLVARLASRWRGPWAGVAAAFLYATGIAVLISESTLLLEPFVTLGCLGAALVATGPTVRPRARSASLAGGLLLGGALSIKLWAGIPMAIIGARYLLRRDVRGLAWLVAGVALSTAVLWLPFVLRDPGAFVQQVFATQTARPADGVSGIAERLASIFAYGPFGSQFLAGAVGSALGVGVATLAVAWAIMRGGTEGRFWAAVLAATTAFFLVSPAYYLHYGAFVAPALAILVGAWLARLAALVAARRQRALTAFAGLASIAVVLFVLLRVGRLQTQVVGPEGDYGQTIAGHVPSGTCVASDDPTWLVLADRRPDVAAGDQPMADLFGAQNVAAIAGSTTRYATTVDLLRSPAAQAVLVGYLESCPYVLVSLPTDTWDPSTLQRLERAYRPIADWTADGGPVLWARR